MGCSQILRLTYKLSIDLLIVEVQFRRLERSERPTMTSSRELTQYRQNWQKEIDGTVLYNTLAEIEAKPELAAVYRRLAASEEKHAKVWEKRLEEAGAGITSRRPSWRALTMSFLAKRFGSQFVLPTVTGNERADSLAYDHQPEAMTELGPHVG